MLSTSLKKYIFKINCSGYASYYQLYQRETLLIAQCGTPSCEYPRFKKLKSQFVLIFFVCLLYLILSPWISDQQCVLRPFLKIAHVLLAKKKGKSRTNNSIQTRKCYFNYKRSASLPPTQFCMNYMAC